MEHRESRKLIDIKLGLLKAWKHVVKKEKDC